MDEKNDEQTELLRLIWVEMKALGANLGTRIEATNNRIDATNASLGARIDAMSANLGARIEATNSRLDVATEKIDSRLGAVEGVLRELAAQQLMLGRFVRSVVDVDIIELRDRIARVEAKLAG